MHYRDLGTTGIKVSAIGFGAWAIGGAAAASGIPLGWGKTNDDDSLAAIRRARDLGVTFFDTADSYGFGRSASPEMARRSTTSHRARRPVHGDDRHVPVESS